MRVCNPQKQAHWITLEALECQVVGLSWASYGAVTVHYLGLCCMGDATAQRSVQIVKKSASTFRNSVFTDSVAVGGRGEHSSELMLANAPAGVYGKEKGLPRGYEVTKN